MLRLPLLTLLLLAACGSSEPAGGPTEQAGAGQSSFPPRPPAEYSRDILTVERTAASMRASMERTLIAGLVTGDGERLEDAFCAGFRGTLPESGSGQVLRDGLLRGLVLEATDGAPLGATEFLARLDAWRALLCTAGNPERGEFELTRLYLAPGGESAVARVNLALFSSAGAPGAGLEPGGRGLWRLEGRARFLLESDGWRLKAFETTGGRYLTNPEAPFVERTRAAGLVVDVDPEMVRLMQKFVDRHVTLALGGLAVMDWNGDGLPDVLQTSRGQSAHLFLNDGRGGFLPGALPCGSPADSGSFALVVDLDGDGAAELVTSRILEYGPHGARLGIYTREGSGWRALDDVLLPVRRGVRRVAIQTIVPFDAGGAGGERLLDLFIGVYGDMHSRGADYNTVEAHDGADNYLLMNRGGLVFEEVSEEAGIRGTQYTYVAEAFDFDGDGDTDLFEGNDFGPNILWENDGQGFFRADADSVLAGVSAYTMGVTLGDPEGSGEWHMYISNMSAAEGMRSAPLAPGLDEVMRGRLATIASGNMLYRQDRESGRWSEVTAGAGCAVAGWAWGCIFWDPDNDGDRDLLVTNGFTSHSRRDLGDWNSLYWRQVAADAGFLARGERTRDVNRALPFEGSFSGYQRDRYFHNLGSPPGAAAPPANGPRLAQFEEAAYLLGLDADHDGRCAVAADVDGDGDQDLVLWTLKGLRLFENRALARAFARVRLASPGPTLGSIVTVSAGGLELMESARLVDGFQSQRPGELHFGLGAAQHIEWVRVRWPDGGTEEWRDLPVKRLLTLTRGQSAAGVDELVRWPDGVFASEVPERLPTEFNSDLEQASPGGAADAVFIHFGAPAPPLAALAQVWSAVSWYCSTSPAAGPPGWRILDRSQLAALCPSGRTPAAALYDGEGNLRRTFADQVSAAELAPLLAEVSRRQAYPEVLVQAGRQALADHRHREARELFRRAIAADPGSPFGHEGLARARSFMGLEEGAIEAYRAALAADPDYALGHHNLGLLLAQRGEHEAAVGALEQALAIDGGQLATLLALGEARATGADAAGALATFEQAIATYPSSPRARLLAGKVLVGQDRRREARSRLEEALALDPDLSEARRALVALGRLEGLPEASGQQPDSDL